jgi:hypothetical protein
VPPQTQREFHLRRLALTFGAGGLRDKAGPEDLIGAALALDMALVAAREDPEGTFDWAVNAEAEARRVAAATNFMVDFGCLTMCGMSENYVIVGNYSRAT